MAYINTNREAGETLAASKEKVEKQEAQVLKFFRKNPNRDFAAHQVHKLMNCNWLFTSTRRAITELEGDGLLNKRPPENRVMGPYKRVYVWGLPKSGQLELFG